MTLSKQTSVIPFALFTGARRKSISNSELRRISAEMFAADANNVYSHISVNTQGKVPYSSSGTDYASNP